MIARGTAYLDGFLVRFLVDFAVRVRLLGIAEYHVQMLVVSLQKCRNRSGKGKRCEGGPMGWPKAETETETKEKEKERKRKSITSARQHLLIPFHSTPSQCIAGGLRSIAKPCPPLPKEEKERQPWHAPAAAKTREVISRGTASKP